MAKKKAAKKKAAKKKVAKKMPKAPAKKVEVVAPRAGKSKDVMKRSASMPEALMPTVSPMLPAPPMMR
jgi:hypothetical protein